MLSTKKLKPLQALIVVLVLGAAFALDQVLPGTKNVVMAFALDPAEVVVAVVAVGGVYIIIRGDGSTTRHDGKGPIK